KYINSAFLDAVKYNNATYAIPNYHDVGEYTYLMVDKALLAEYGRIPADITTSSIYDGECKVFLDYIHEDKDDVYPIYTDSADGLLDFGPVYYWSHDLDNAAGIKVNKDQFSIFGDVFADTAEKGAALSYDNLLADQEYMETLALKRYYESTEGYITNDPSQKYNAAACVVKGDWELRHEYEKQGYACFVMEKPRVTTEDVFSSMFAIGGKTGYTNRAMEIIAYLNTNAEVRNVLQYGVAETNYTLHGVDYVENDTIKTLHYVIPTNENIYEMDINKTGNVFLAYPSFTQEEVAGLNDEQLIEAIRVKTTYKQEKNLEMMTDPTLGMYYNYTTATGSYALDVESVMIVNLISDRVAAVLNTLTADQVRGIYNTAKGKSSLEMAEYFLALAEETMTYQYVGASQILIAAGKTDAFKDCKTEADVIAVLNGLDAGTTVGVMKDSIGEAYLTGRDGYDGFANLFAVSVDCNPWKDPTPNDGKEDPDNRSDAKKLEEKKENLIKAMQNGEVQYILVDSALVEDEAFMTRLSVLPKAEDAPEDEEPKEFEFTKVDASIAIAKTVVVETVVKALESMADNQLVDDGEKVGYGDDNQKESPNAFYQAWLAALAAAI
ncbi:MAG: hypothetical protein IKM08_06485, partial [Clostridia bacterium]|nr:hypothetical protein [Clostridia bacterium]